jgi:class 3 adenylate cyclase
VVKPPIHNGRVQLEIGQGISMWVGTAASAMMMAVDPSAHALSDAARQLQAQPGVQLLHFPRGSATSAS